jgi:uncharacterized Zn finger protein
MKRSGIEPLNRLISGPRLQRLAGPVSLARGQKYFAEGRVQSLRYDRYAVRATVAGTELYKVALWEEQGDLEYSCSCPIGRESSFCKHCVATALAWLAQGTDEAGATPATNLDEIRAYLSRLPTADLVEMIMARAQEDDGLLRKLLLQASVAARGPDLVIWRQAFDEAMREAEQLFFVGTGSIADGLAGHIDSLDALLVAGRADSVVELAEHALAGLEDLLGQVDDSDGELGGVLDRLQELHLTACEQSLPDGEALAQRLFEREMQSDFDVFHHAVQTYAELLGAKGIATYRRLAEAEWATVPAVMPGQRDPEHRAGRSTITSIMEALAELSDDLETWVAIKSRDLSWPYSFLEIAEAYARAGQADRALDWAERGWRAFAGVQRDDRLLKFLADSYRQCGRDQDAIDLAWQAFVEQPGLDTYKFLKLHAERSQQWQVRRSAALAHIRDLLWEREAPRSATRQTSGSDRRADHSILVEILLWEGEAEAAWREAQNGGCAHTLWLRLAESRQQTHPLDAVAIYRRCIPPIVDRMNQQAYEAATDLLIRIKTLLAADKPEELAAYAAEIRTSHRRKRNFIKLLDQQRW